MTLKRTQGHSPTASRFKCDSYSCAAAVDKISTDTARRTVPLQQRSFLSIATFRDGAIWRSRHKVECRAQLQTFLYPMASKSFMYSNALQACAQPHTRCHFRKRRTSEGDSQSRTL